MQKRKKINRKGKHLSGFPLVRSELNLEQNSVFTVSTCRKKSREIVKVERFSSGEIRKRRVIIGRTASGAETGILTVHHFKTYLVLVELWEGAGKPINERVHFSIVKIIKRLGLNFDGRTYQRIKRWLKDLHQIPVTFIDSFFFPKEGTYRTIDPLHVLSYLSIYERKKGAQDKTYGYGEFRFDDHILEGLLNNYTHPLRLDVIKEFKKHKELAILIYVYIDRNLAFKNSYSIRLQTLFEHLDLSQRYIRSPADRKVKLEPVFAQLKGKPLSTGILKEIQVVKTEDGKDYKAIFVKTPYPTRPSLGEERQEEESEKKALAQTSKLETPKPDLEEKLHKIGLSFPQIQKIFQRYPEELVRDWVDAYPWWKERADNPPAYLLKALEEEWALPENYLRKKSAKHYALWRCSSPLRECRYSRYVIKTPLEKGIPEVCPECGDKIEVLNRDYIESE